MAKRQPEVFHQADGTAVIPLTRDLVTIVDREDADLGEVLWLALPNGGGHIYAARRVQNGDGWAPELMHRVILERKLGRPLRPDEQVDHINGDPLDNRRANLRPVTQAQNLRNSRVRVNNTSGYKGVHWDKQRRRWRALIWHKGQNRHLGYFDSRIEAAHAYDDAARELYGPYAAVNFPRDGEQPARRNHAFGSVS